MVQNGLQGDQLETYLTNILLSHTARNICLVQENQETGSHQTLGTGSAAVTHPK